MAIISFALSMSGAFACSFYSYEDVWNFGNGVITNDIGLWSWKGLEQISSNTFTYVCYSYPSGFYYDPAMQAGRAFSMMAGILSIILLAIVCSMICLPWPPKIFTIVAGMAIITGVFQLISLVRTGEWPLHNFERKRKPI